MSDSGLRVLGRGDDRDAYLAALLRTGWRPSLGREWSYRWDVQRRSLPLLAFGRGLVSWRLDNWRAGTWLDYPAEAHVSFFRGADTRGTLMLTLGQSGESVNLADHSGWSVVSVSDPAH